MKAGENGMDKPLLTLICPAHNEAGNIARLLQEWHAEFTRLGEPFELILVDDGSTDGTAAEARRMQGELTGIRLLRHAARCGQSAALVTGISHAAGRIMVTCDADLQNDPADLPRMLDLLPDADVVCGWRRNRQDVWRRRFVSRCANRVLQRLFGHQLHGFFSLVALIEGFTVVEIPVNHRSRMHGASKYGLLNRLFRTVRDLTGLAWYQSRRIPPAELMGQEEHLERLVTASTGLRDNAEWPATIPMRLALDADWPEQRKSA
jgi:dolichol-phosphate mannosyltransferase